MNHGYTIALSGALLLCAGARAQDGYGDDPDRAGPPRAPAEVEPPREEDRTLFERTDEEELRFQPWSGAIDPLTGRMELAGAPPEREPQPRLLFSDHVAQGGYGGPVVKLTQVLDSPAAIVGVQGGWVIDHHWVVGLAGYGLASRHDVPVETRVNGQPSHLELGYGGVRVGYLLEPHQLVHLGVGFLIGAGGLVAVSGRRYDSLDEERHTGHGDALVAVEPELEVELNVVRFMRIALGASYRYLGGVDAPGLTARKLSAPAGGVVLRFGVF